MSIETFTRRAAVDWPPIVTALQAAGYSLRDVAYALGIGHAIVRSWQVPRRGMDRTSIPNYEDGCALLDLAAHLGVPVVSNPTVAHAAGCHQPVESPRS
jgi:hypothetical protein